MRDMFRAGALALTVALLVTGCMWQQGVEDVSGVMESEAMELSLAEQYALAGERYHEVNDRMVELQREIFEDEWREGATPSEVLPGQGANLSSAPRGATNDNSYFFSVARWHGVDGEIKPLLREIAGSWEARGWDVSGEVIATSLRITASTEDGFFFDLVEEKEEIELMGFTPVYWGERRALSRAIAPRRDAENEAGAPWDTTDRDKKGYAYRLPGEYRPFPAWDAAP